MPSAVSPQCAMNIQGSDEEYMICLRLIAQGGPNPPNVHIDLNPFNFHPENLPGDILHLVNSDELRFFEAGYWEQTGQDVRIMTNSPTNVGWRTTLQFYEGQAPNGVNTNWVMHVYKLDQTDQNSRLLCRVFNNLDFGEDVGLLLSNILTAEENNSASQHCRSGSQVVDENENRPPPASRSHMQNNPRADYATQDLRDEDYFSDYLEMDDLVGYESSSSGTDNSSVVMDSDLENGINADSESQNVKRFMTSATDRYNKVVIRTPSAGSLHNNGSNPNSTDVLTPNNIIEKSLKTSRGNPPSANAQSFINDEKALKRVSDANQRPPNLIGGENKGSLHNNGSKANSTEVLTPNTVIEKGLKTGRENPTSATAQSFLTEEKALERVSDDYNANQRPPNLLGGKNKGTKKFKKIGKIFCCCYIP